MAPPAVELRHVSKSYREGEAERVVLRDVSLTIAPGEIVVLLGRSGSGKSTLLNVIAGIDRPTAGTVMVDGTDLTALDEQARRSPRRGTPRDARRDAARRGAHRVRRLRRLRRDGIRRLADHGAAARASPAAHVRALARRDPGSRVRA